MAITQEELGRRLRVAREGCRFTQDQVAKHLGVSRSAMVQIEAGNRDVSSLELDKLAYYLGRDMRDLVADAFHEEDSLAALFRAQPDVGDQAEVLGRLRQCLAFGREATQLENLLGFDRDFAALASYSLPLPRSRWEAIRHGERLAGEERRRLSLGDAPLPDVTTLLEGQGVRTGLIDLPESVSGLTIVDRTAGIFVVANRRHPPLRQRYSLAHEYCHVIADRSRSGLVSRDSDRNELIEVRANTFAANFLMPQAGILKFVDGLGKGRPSRTSTEVFDEAESILIEGRSVPGSQAIQLYDVARIAHHFVASRVSVLFRLRNLRLLNEAEMEQLKNLDEAGKGKQLARLLGLPSVEAAQPAGSLKDRFLGLALECYRRDEISRGKLAELVVMVGIQGDELDLLLEDAGLDEPGSLAT